MGDIISSDKAILYKFRLVCLSTDKVNNFREVEVSGDTYSTGYDMTSIMSYGSYVSSYSI